MSIDQNLSPNFNASGIIAPHVQYSVPKAKMGDRLKESELTANLHTDFL